VDDEERDRDRDERPHERVAVARAGERIRRDPARVVVDVGRDDAGAHHDQEAQDVLPAPPPDAQRARSSFHFHASVVIWVRTSSTVTTPRSFPWPSSTGTASRLYFSVISATRSGGSSGRTETGSRRMISSRRAPGSTRSRWRIVTTPWSRAAGSTR